MLDQPPVPMKPRWNVWTDDTAYRSSPALTLSGARWLWAASGPRGHESGAETTADEAVRRAELAAMQLDRPQDTTA